MTTDYYVSPCLAFLCIINNNGIVTTKVDNQKKSLFITKDQSNTHSGWLSVITTDNFMELLAPMATRNDILYRSLTDAAESVSASRSLPLSQHRLSNKLAHSLVHTPYLIASRGNVYPDISYCPCAWCVQHVYCVSPLSVPASIRS